MGAKRLGGKIVLRAKQLGYATETTKGENRGETTGGENYFGAKRLVTVKIIFGSAGIAGILTGPYSR